MTQKREPTALINNLVDQDMLQAAPMVQWVGGKRRLAPHILPLFPEHTCYVELNSAPVCHICVHLDSQMCNFAGKVMIMDAAKVGTVPIS